MSERVFTISFGISLGLHLLVLVGQLFSLGWLGAPRLQRPLDVVYEYELAERELRHLQDQLARATREAAALAPSAGAADRPQIRIPERPLLTAHRSVADILPDRSSIVDLTNLVDAARGDPVLLSYFSAIREQIQHTANRRAWLTGEAAEGLVYVSFTLNAAGALQGVAVLSDRSAASRTLQEIAARIVRAAAPFPSFPPSMSEPSKVIVVPLEFLLGSGS